MTLYRNKYRVESIRLKGFDYSTPGEYFVTICTKGMVELFGEVIQGRMNRNEIGEIAHECWVQILKHHKDVLLDEFIIMPNHVHGILILCGTRNHRNASASCNFVSNAGPGRTVDDIAPDNPVGDVACNVAPGDKNEFMSAISPKRGSLGAVIRSFKSSLSNWCHVNDFEDFQWQSRYHDHIISDKGELKRIRDYIRNNPAKWEADRNNPRAVDHWL